MRHAALPAALAAALLALPGVVPSEDALAQGAPDRPFQTAVVARFESPWAMTFLPDGRMLVTEKAGRLILLDPASGQKIAVEGVPRVDSAGQGALKDVVPHPDFAKNRIVYFSYSESRGGARGAALATGVLAEANGAARLDAVKAVFRADPYMGGSGHYSARIAFAPDGKHLFFTNGDRQAFDPAQDPKSTLGKVLRLNLDGTPAAGNPLAAKGFHPAIWSYGHRNLLGVAFDSDGRLWENEMGPRGGDEVNLIRPGLNYGWPKVSQGDHYGGTKIPRHAPGDGYEPPKVFWNPSISPAGLIHYSGAMFPQWKGSLFMGALSGQALIRVKLDGEMAAKADQWDMGARIRDVEQGPDGALWLIEDGDAPAGRLLRLTPK